MRRRNHTIIALLLTCLVLVTITGCAKPQQTVILISIDGFRWDYVDRAETPNLDALIRNGVKAKWLIPSFPTKTFPNHYTIVTGLYPGHHGIVANNMYHPQRKAYFSLGLRDAIRDPAWWGGEPIWVTAEKQGLTTASFFWPGSEAPIGGIQPTYWKAYDGSVSHEERIQQVLRWLDLPEEQRPVFITAYFSSIDDLGHRVNPDSELMVPGIQAIDSTLGLLLDGLKARQLLQKVNILIVSDHGMAATSPERIIFLDDYVDLDSVHVVDWNPVAGINAATSDLREIYARLANAHPHMSVYLREDIPARFHYRGHPCIPEIIAIADEGWSITSRKTFDPVRFSGGNHGYDNSLQSMQSIFIASGPAFKKGIVVEPIENIHLYELMAHILAVEPSENDGSLDAVKAMLR